jgi:hypothetical protein
LIHALLINALALSRLSGSAPAGRIPAGNGSLGKSPKRMKNQIIIRQDCEMPFSSAQDCARIAFAAKLTQQKKASKCGRSVLLTLYEVRPRKDKPGVDLISDVLPFDWASYDDEGLSASRSMSRAS